MWRKQVRILEGERGGMEAGLAGDVEVKPEDSSATLTVEEEGLARQSLLLPSEIKEPT